MEGHSLPVMCAISQLESNNRGCENRAKDRVSCDGKYHVKREGYRLQTIDIKNLIVWLNMLKQWIMIMCWLGQHDCMGSRLYTTV